MRFNRTLRADGSIVCNDCGNMLTSSNLTLADLRAQVARLEKRVQELTPAVDELIKAETKLVSILPLVRAVLEERAVEVAFFAEHGMAGRTPAWYGLRDASRVRREAADAIPAEVLEWAKEGE